MPDVFFTRDHEYMRVEGDTGIVGITDYAQSQLGDVVFVELPAPGTKVKQGEKAAVVESVKAASEVYAPISGEVVEVNEDLSNTPEKLNEDPHGAAWLIKVKVDGPGDFNNLLSVSDYQSYVGAES